MIWTNLEEVIDALLIEYAPTKMRTFLQNVNFMMQEPATPLPPLTPCHTNVGDKSETEDDSSDSESEDGASSSDSDSHSEVIHFLPCPLLHSGCGQLKIDIVEYLVY